VTPDPRDVALQRACPCVPVPRFGPLDDAELGQRVLVASNGIFLEVRRSWLQCIVRIGELPRAPPLPYGSLSERIAFTFGVIPIALLEEFIAIGRNGLPNEVAGALIYHRTSNRLRLAIHDAIKAGPAEIRYRMPVVGSDEEVAVDLHTHGRLPAFWSSTDDADDQGVKVCGVFGNLHQEMPSAAFRLAINGQFRELPHPWSAKSLGSVPSVELGEACPTLVAMGLTEIDVWNT
jgi:PRTRC genetic system protein A